MKVITIGRECGSGGHTIGQEVAKELGIPFYDKDIIAMVADKCKVSEEYVKTAGELISGGFFAHVFSNGSYPYEAPSLQDQINSEQVNVIRELAETPCVIIGRGADYILKDRDDVLNVFIHAHSDYKIAQSVKKHNIDPKDAKAILKKRDKERSKHYYFYTGQEWANHKNYDLVLDSGSLGEAVCVKLIVEAYKAK